MVEEATIGALLPLIYAISAFILWYTIPRVEKYQKLWYSLGFGMFFIYVYFLSRMLELKTFGFFNDLILLIGGMCLIIFSILFLKTEELRTKK